MADLSSYYDGPVWEAFGLTRASYYVVPRRALQSMPADWQARFVALVNEMHAALPSEALDGDYTVQVRINGRFGKDPMAQYRHTGPVATTNDVKESTDE